MRISFLLPLVFLGLTGCIDVHEHPAPQPDRDRCDTGAGADHDLCHAAAARHDRRAHALIGDALGLIERGPGQIPALFICATPWCRGRYLCRLELG